MAGIGKRLAGLLGEEQVDKLKNIGSDAIGDIIGNFTGKEDKDDALPPPTGQRFDAPAPETKPVDTTPPNTTRKSSVADKILELNKLREQGVLTDAEFAALKNELLND